MIFYPEERTALFIDGANLYATARALDMEIDYKSLRSHFTKQTRLIRAFYYTAILEDQEYSPLRPLIDWLDYNGFTLVTKPVKEFTDEHGRRKIKGNMDIEIAVDMLNISEALDHVVLFSGDGDFRRLLEAVQRKGLRATVISSNSTQPSMIADELRRQADQFVDLEDMRSIIGRKGGGPRRAGAAAPFDAGFEEQLGSEQA
ncbi:NYN domain-containing protein [Kordiimonas sp.]|uniref:LabA-like NYN domain-containing protein n=1 Tax=Kordiimonas sp. TaxID=1970157 RepID=UPI003A9235A6